MARACRWQRVWHGCLPRREGALSQPAALCMHLLCLAQPPSALADTTGAHPERRPHTDRKHGRQFCHAAAAIRAGQSRAAGHPCGRPSVASSWQQLPSLGARHFDCRDTFATGHIRRAADPEAVGSAMASSKSNLRISWTVLAVLLLRNGLLERCSLAGTVGRRGGVVSLRV